MLPFELTKDIPYLALSGELWSVFYEYLNRNWSCYTGFILYVVALYIYRHWGGTGTGKTMSGSFHPVNTMAALAVPDLPQNNEPNNVYSKILIRPCEIMQL